MPASRTSFEGHSIQEKTTDFIALRLHRTLEVRELAVGHVIAPAFDNAERAVLLEDRRGLRRHVYVGLLVACLHGAEESVDVAHGLSPECKSVVLLVSI